MDMTKLPWSKSRVCASEQFLFKVMYDLNYSGCIWFSPYTSTLLAMPMPALVNA